MRIQNPRAGDWVYFVDKCLPFGVSISCALFQRFSDALCHIFEHQTLTHGLVTNYLDDFLLLALTILACNKLITHFLSLCEELGIPVSLDKMEWGSELIIFLGILLDGRNFCLGIPVDKRCKAIVLLQEMIGKCKAKVKNLQVLSGYLNFLSKAIFPGQTFVRRMYVKFSDVINLGGAPVHSNEYKLKQHHHVKLDDEFKQDCRVWLNFLDENMERMVCRPMVDILGIPATSDEICFYSDASTAKNLGFGCLLNNSWIQGYWGEQFIINNKPSIKFLELYALVAGVLTWESAPVLVNCHVVVFCDNQAVVQMINSMSSSCERCMHFLRLVVLNGLKFNRRLSAKFVPTKSNGLADALSRGQWSHFRKLGPNMNATADKISEIVWPVDKVWY